YWDGRYARRFASGRPPKEIDERNRLLWAAVERELHEIDHVVDVGCGDLRIWGDRDCRDYVGIDIAEEVVQDNKPRRPHWRFLCAPAETYIVDLVRENVFCFNLIFHILDPENTRRIFHNLCRYASKRIFVHTWIQSPPKIKTDEGVEYQMYHSMGKYLPLFNEMGFELISVEWIEQTRHSIKEVLGHRTPSALYIFKKKHIY
ncbi:MAG: class I SAM-dependent methyltransferase, partial [Thermoplasmata archaeon]|nr:class I SAM-dependent methyltransferase [Thermoplasmata archaeon]